MPEPRPHQNRPHPNHVDDLLRQDAGLTEDLLRRERMQLQENLKAMEERARKVRRASWIGAGMTIATCLAVLPMEAFQLSRIPWVPVVWAIVGNLSLITTGILLTLYWHKYRPAIDRQRSDIQMSVLAEIQRQVAELRAEVARQNRGT